MKAQTRIYSSLLFIISYFTYFSIAAQDMTATFDPAGPTQDSMTISVINLPAQIVPVSFDKVTPSYRYFYDDVTPNKYSITVK